MSTTPRYLYLRLLRHADHAVFGVQSGQKNYWHPIFSTKVPFSSGQQVKRSILEALTDRLDEDFAPVQITQVFKRAGAKTSLGDGEPLSSANPAFADQLIGGWMRAQKQDKSKSKKQANDESEVGSDRTRVYRRRSPLSISAMHPLHPLLANLDETEALTFDRTGVRGHHSVIVRDENGNEMMRRDETTGKLVPNETLQAWLDGRGESLKLRTFMPAGKVGGRATGLFIVDVAIDLDRLYTVSVDPYDPEINDETAKALLEDGWVQEGTRLRCTEDRRKAIGEGLADALVGWRITSNQARTMSLQDTLAIAVSTDANLLASAIRATLNTDGEKDRAQPVVDQVDDVTLFASPVLEAYISPQNLPETDAQAMSKAAAFLREKLAF